MASQLYKVLNNIERERTELVHTLNSLGGELSKDASLSAINNTLKSTVSTVTNKLSDRVTYYDNYEDDPDVWTMPKEWPDIETILKNTDSFTADGYTYYPAGIVLFKTNEIDSIIAKGASWTNTNALTDDKKTLFVGNTMSKAPLYVLFNDGSKYKFTSDDTYNNYTHIWNHDKDINGYKYFIIFGINSSSNNQYVTVCSNINSYSKIEFEAGVFTLGTIASSNICGGRYTDSLSKIKYIKIIEQDWVDLSLPYTYTYVGMHSSFRYLRKLEIIIDKDIQTTFGSVGSIGSTNSCIPYSLNTFITNNYSLAHLAGSTPSLVYYEAPVFNFARTSASNSGSRLKYLVITDKDLQADMYPASTCSLTTQLHNLDLLSSTESLGYSMSASAYNLNYWDLSHIKEITTSNSILGEGCCGEILDLSGLKVVNNMERSFDKCSFRKVILSGLESLNSPVEIVGMTELDLSSVKTITSTNVCGYDPATFLLYIDLRSLEIYPENLFNNCYNLHTIIWPSELRHSLNLTPLRRLSRKSWLEFMDRVADVSQETGIHKITLTTYSQASHTVLDESEIQILRDKGWEVVLSG